MYVSPISFALFPFPYMPARHCHEIFLVLNGSKIGLLNFGLNYELKIKNCKIHNKIAQSPKNQMMLLKIFRLSYKFIQAIFIQIKKH